MEKKTLHLVALYNIDLNYLKLASDTLGLQVKLFWHYTIYNNAAKGNAFHATPYVLTYLICLHFATFYSQASINIHGKYIETVPGHSSIYLIRVSHISFNAWSRGHRMYINKLHGKSTEFILNEELRDIEVYVVIKQRCICSCALTCTFITRRKWWRHQMETFPRYWSFVRGIHRSPVNSPHKGQWRGTLMFSLICALNKRLSKQPWGWWFETTSLSLWRHCNEKSRYRRIFVKGACHVYIQSLTLK